MTDINLLIEQEIEWIENNINSNSLKQAQHLWSSRTCVHDNHFYNEIYRNFIYSILNEYYGVRFIANLNENKLSEFLALIKKHHKLRAFK